MFFSPRRLRLTGMKLADVFMLYPRAFRVMLFGAFIDRVGGSMIFPFLAIFISRKFHVGFTEVALGFSIMSITSLAGNTLGGALTDHIGRRAMMLFGLVTSAAITLGFVVADSLPMLYAVCAVAGLMDSLGGPAHSAMVADLLPEHRRAEGYGMLRVIANLAMAVGPLVGGLLLAWTGGYLTLFMLDISSSLIAAVIVYLWVPETRPRPDARHGQAESGFLDTLIGYRRVFRDGVFLAFMGMTLISNLVYLQMYGTLSYYLTNIRHQPEALYGTLLSMNAFMVVIFQFPLTRRVAERPPMVMAALAALCYALGFSMFGFTNGYAPLVVAMIVITIGEMLQIPVSQALVMRLAPEDMRGRYGGVMGISWIVGQMVGPVGAGLIIDRLNPDLLWYICGLLGLATTLGFLALRQPVEARLAEAPAVPVAEWA